MVDPAGLIWNRRVKPDVPQRADFNWGRDDFKFLEKIFFNFFYFSTRQVNPTACPVGEPGNLSLRPTQPILGHGPDSRRARLG